MRWFKCESGKVETGEKNKNDIKIHHVLFSRRYFQRLVKLPKLIGTNKCTGRCPTSILLMDFPSTEEDLGVTVELCPQHCRCLSASDSEINSVGHSSRLHSDLANPRVCRSCDPNFSSNGSTGRHAVGLRRRPQLHERVPAQLSEKCKLLEH
ncbi:hypothetical protein BDV29DRAFT_177416 [Aspergillus leporis]|uniref:Uncharacterized protein n=1 Tax=Aspergillus leporis TaxID=41062 RepID=A0A5N5WZ27_9EURO|nr:hypothetical protein BDV29DRAFT_177416 [Aspergillus leporis]